MIYERKLAAPIEYYFKDDCPHEYVHWKEATTNGQWVATDDGCVVKVRNVKEITEVRNKSIRVRRRITFERASRYAHGKREYHFLDVMANGKRHNSDRTWWQEMVDQEPALIGTFALLILAGEFNFEQYRYNRRQYGLFEKISKKFYGKETRWCDLRTFFNHSEIRMTIQKKIDAILEAKHIDVNKVIGLLLTAEQKAIEYTDKNGNGNPMAILAVADRYAGLIGMNGKNELKNNNDHGQLGELPGSEKTYDQILNAHIPEAVIVEEVKI